MKALFSRTCTLAPPPPRLLLFLALALLTFVALDSPRAARADAQYNLSWGSTTEPLTMTVGDNAVYYHVSFTNTGSLPWPNGGPNPVYYDVVYFVTIPGDASSIATYGFKFAGSPPLEFIHYDERHGTHRYTILGASDEFRAKEASSFATIEAGSGRSRR